MVCEFILLLYYYSSALLVSSPQILLYPIWPHSAIFPLWLFPYWCSWLHVFHISYPHSETSHNIGQRKVVLHCGYYLPIETCSCFGTEHLLIQRHSIAMKLLKYVQGQFEQIILITDKGHCSSYQLDCNYVWSLERNCIHSFLTIYNISSTLIWISRV